jgi:hypothetical protein
MVAAVTGRFRFGWRVPNVIRVIAHLQNREQATANASSTIIL